MLARVFSASGCCADCQGRDRLGRRPHLSGGGAHGDTAERHQAHPGVFDDFPARLHGAGGGRRSGARRADVSSLHARLFKCLLFLCAGSVIVALHHEQDIWQMGGLRGKTP